MCELVEAIEFSQLIKRRFQVMISRCRWMHGGRIANHFRIYRSKLHRFCKFFLLLILILILTALVAYCGGRNSGVQEVFENVSREAPMNYCVFY